MNEAITLGLHLNSKTSHIQSMSKNVIMTSTPGIFSFLFLIAASIGTVFQFVYLYQHVMNFAPGDTLFIILYSFSISAMVTGGSGILWSLFRSSKFQLISAGFFMMAFALVLPSYIAATLSVFPYVFGAAAQVPWLGTIPTAPMLDFVGFWLATGGGFMAMLFGFAVPRRQIA
jgi:hypothetical protein